MLFNLCVNYIPGFVYASDTYMPKIHEKCINILLYADMVVIEYSQVSLKRLLQKLNTCNINSVNINKTKSKVCLFAKYLAKKV